MNEIFIRYYLKDGEKIVNAHTVLSASILDPREHIKKYYEMVNIEAKKYDAEIPNLEPDLDSITVYDLVKREKELL